MARRSVPTIDFHRLGADHVSEQVTWPELRLVRQASRARTPQSEEWRNLLDAIGGVNYGKGFAVALGSVHLTYVTANEMGRMLQRKFPKAYENRTKTMQLQTRIARHWIEFTRQDTKNTVDSIFGKIDLPDAAAYDEALETETDQRKWSTGLFAFDEMDAFGTDEKDLGFVPAAHESVLDREMESAMDFLTSEGLDPSVVDRTRGLHAIVFKGFANISGSRLYVPDEWPSGMLLDAPKMIHT